MGFIERELTQIKKALGETSEGPLFDRLYAAQQALEWTQEPTGFKSPYKMIMGIQEDLTDCSNKPHPPQSSNIYDHCELQQ